MKKILQAIILVFTATSFSSVFAQPGCPAVNAGNDMIIPCGQTCTTLNATAFSAAETNAYTVGSISYNPPFGFNAGTPILVNIDDVYGNVINLPFNFCFFGTVYNQIIVGSNGVISFNTANANGTNSWQINGPIPSPTPPDLLNCIMGPWQDIDPTNQGQIHYQISGTVPCRSFEVSWYRVPYYGDPNSVSTGSCNSPLFATQQIVLYETTNAIEMYIENKEVCSGWNGGLAVEGIQNATGTVAYTVPGRNATQWTAQNDAWRFTPAGNSNTTLAWFDGLTQIGTGSSVQVCPTISHSYTAQAVYTNCDATTTTVTDNVFVGISGISIQIDSTLNPKCNGGNDGAVYASFSSTGSAVLSYGWSPGGTPNQTSLTNIPAGTYIFSVTDATNCTRYDTAVLADPAVLLVNVPDSNAYSCTPGVVSGSLTAYATGGTGSYSYSWNTSPVQNTPTATGLSAGNYSVTVTDVNGCSGSDNGTVIAVIAPPVFNPPVIKDVSCFGGSDGSIIVSLGQAVPPNTFTWSDNLPSNDTVTGLSPGTYSVTGTDVNGCSATASYTVNQPTAVSIGTPILTQATCTAGGSICVTASGGGGVFIYTWSNAETGNCIDSLAAGPYDLTVTDQNLCSATATYTVTSIAGVVSFGNPTIVDVLCNGENTGSITATATGGTGTIIFTWSNQVTGAVNSGIPAGSYSVTITDVANCTASTTYIVNEPTPIVIDNPIITQATCTVGGSISVTATGGTGTLTYLWSNADTTTFVDSLAAGPYILTVTDQNACSVSASYIVPADPSVVSFGTPIIVDIACNGDSTGSITATATGGTGTIQFFWSYNNTNSATISSVPAGSYSVTITDQNGCTASTTYTVNQPTPVTVGNPVITQISCVSGGSICITAAGGNGGYIYIWSNTDSGNCIDSLQAGPYDVTVTDQNLCSVTGSFTVTGSVGVVIFGAPVITNVTCAEGSNGSITATASGGTGTITYVWSNQVTGAVNSNLSVGCYSVTASDPSGCSASATYCVTEPAFIVLGNPILTQATCQAGGSICVTASGGTGTLVYLWSNTETGNCIDSLAAGPYDLTVTDQNGCSVSASYTVTAAPGVVVFGSPLITNVTCHGDSTGSITASASGGTGTITFAWSNQQSGATISSLPVGSYSVTITDAVGCSAATTYTVSEPTAINPNLTISQLICFGATNGTACAAPAGGTPGYTYVWHTGAQTACISGQPGGIVVVTVTDAVNCSVRAQAIIGQAEQLSYVRILNLHPCQVPSSGDLSIVVRGGVGAVIVDVPGVGIDTATRIGSDSIAVFPPVSAGNYTFTLTDTLGCTVTGNFFVPQSAANDNFTVDTDPTTCFAFSDGAITLTTNSQNGPYTYSLNGGAPQSNNTFTNLIAGTYTIVTSNTYGCLNTYTAVVNQPAQVSANASPDTIVTAPGVDNSVTVSVQNFDNPVYTWTPTQGLSCTDCSNPIVNVDAATVFYVTVSESELSHCAAFDSVVVIVSGGFVMPNAFTPNGDRKNDLFGPVSFGFITVKEFRIYNRWGEMVHNDINNWDGTFSGKDQPVGTYVYYIQIQSPDKDNPGTQKTDNKEGSFSLIR